MQNGLSKLIHIVLVLTSMNVLGQTVKGKVVDAKTGETLVYVNIGVVGTSIGTISNLKGEFTLKFENQPANGIIRFTMIGYQSQEFVVSELLNTELVINLLETPVLLEAVTIKPKRFVKKRKGTKIESKLLVTGWYGVGEGYENGIKIKVKNSVYVEALHFYIAQNDFDSVLLRLHIRKIIDDIPAEEMLTENILIPVSIASGWVDVDLKNYDLSYTQNFAITLEWLQAWGRNEMPNLLLSMSIIKGTIYSKIASEADWVIYKNKSPGMYLDVLESK
jgi:carboxypeptidase-like protein